MQDARRGRQRATCNVQRATHNEHAIPCVADDARPTACSAQQCVATRWVRRRYKVPSCNRHNTCHRQPLPPKENPRPKQHPRQCRRFCGGLAEIRFERERTNAPHGAMRTSAQYRCCEVQALARPCRPTCGRRGRTSSFTGRICTSACHTRPQMSKTVRNQKGELELCAFACDARLFPRRCARHNTTCASALCAVVGSTTHTLALRCVCA